MVVCACQAGSLSASRPRRRESISRGAETYEHTDDTENIKNLERSSLSSALDIPIELFTYANAASSQHHNIILFWNERRQVRAI